MQFTRDLKKQLIEMAQHYPVVTITGPRQAGKTTLARDVFPTADYVNLESPDVRELAINDPVRFLNNLKHGAIIDEIQNVPNLLSYIQVIVDETKKVGQFVLTGSHQLALNAAITQSLAGRTALLTLLPLSISELLDKKPNLGLDEILLKGFYPKANLSSLASVHLHRQYVQTYLERDLRQLINLKDLASFQRFLVLCASNVGQLVNYQKMANAIGVSVNTAKEWFNILEASYVVVRLQPYFANIKKRLVKSPKLYFVDVGLAAYLLGIETLSHIKVHPLRGSLFENMVVLDLIKNRLNKALDPRLSFYRDSNGNEVDVLFEASGEVLPIEIKSSETFHMNFFDGINKLSISLPNAKSGYVIYAGKQEQMVGDNQLLNFRKLKEII